jgi:hypothetical protein
MLTMHDVATGLEVIKVGATLSAVSPLTVRPPPAGQLGLTQHSELERWKHATLYKRSYDDVGIATIGELGLGVKRQIETLFGEEAVDPIHRCMVVDGNHGLVPIGDQAA